MSCRPIVSTGLSDVIGSWKIIEISRPRTSRIALSLIARMSRPSNRMEPPTIRPGFATRRRISDSPVTDFPDPDSPTIPSVSPCASEKETSSTARTPSSPLPKSTFRFETSRIGLIG